MSHIIGQFNRVFISLIFFIVACEKPNVKYYGFNDLVAGSQRIILYENQRFYLELGLGGIEGDYLLKGDTIIFVYDKKPSNIWPDKILMQRNQFISLNYSFEDRNRIRIKRYK